MQLRELFPLAYKDTLEWNTLSRESPPSIEDQEDIVAEEFLELEEALAADDLKETLDALADIFFTAAYLEHLSPSHRYVEKAVNVLVASVKAFGHVAIEAAIQEVVESNLTKFVNVGKSPYTTDDKTLKRLIDSEVERLKLKHEMDITCTQRGKYLVFTDENNKIRKPFSYVEPNIDMVIDNFLFGDSSLDKFKENV